MNEDTIRYLKSKGIGVCAELRYKTGMIVMAVKGDERLPVHKNNDSVTNYLLSQRFELV